MATGLMSFFAVMTALVLLVCGVALAPALIVVGAVGLVLWLIVGAFGLVLRIVGGLLLLLFAAPLLFAGFALTFALGIALLHAALPILLVVGIVWLITRHNKNRISHA